MPHGRDLEAAANAALQKDNRNAELSQLAKQFDRFNGFHLWLLGVTGSGKSTLAGLLSGNSSHVGSAGFKHHTLEITQLTAMVFDQGQHSITGIRIMDTRGFMDVEYSVENLQSDVYSYSKFHPSKVAVVVKQERLTRMHFDFLQDAAEALGPLSVVLTGCTSGGVQEFERLMHDRNVPLLSVLCYHHWLDDKPVKRREILQYFLNASYVDIDRWYKHGLVMKVLQAAEQKAYRLAKSLLGSNWLAEAASQFWNILIVLAPCIASWGPMRMIRGLSRAQRSMLAIGLAVVVGLVRSAHG